MRRVPAAAKYEEWAAELEARRGALGRDRRRMRWLLLPALLTAPVGLHWSLLIAVWIFCAWIATWAVGTYIAVMYDWDYQRQLEALRGEIAHLEGALGSPVAEPVDRWKSRRARHPGQLRFRS